MVTDPQTQPQTLTQTGPITIHCAAASAQCNYHQKRRQGSTGVLPQWLHNSPTISNVIVSGEAILSAEDSGKPLGGRDSAPNTAEEAHSAPPDALAGDERGCCSVPKNPAPVVRLRPIELGPNEKSSARP